jgi:hypothetical protein
MADARRGILDEIKEMVESEGLPAGTPEYEKRYLTLKVERCKQLHGVNECSACVAYEECSLVREFSFLQRYKMMPPK